MCESSTISALPAVAVTLVVKLVCVQELRDSCSLRGFTAAYAAAYTCARTSSLNIFFLALKKRIAQYKTG